MHLFNLSCFIAAAIILIWNDELLNLAEKKLYHNEKRIDRRKVFFGTMFAVAVLIIKGLFL